MYSFEVQTLQGFGIHFQRGVLASIMKIRPSLHFREIDLHGGVGYEDFKLIPYEPCRFVIFHGEQACALEIFISTRALSQNIAMVLRIELILLWTWRGRICPWLSSHPCTCSWLQSMTMKIPRQCFQGHRRSAGSMTRFGSSSWIVTMRELFIHWPFIINNVQYNLCFYSKGVQTLINLFYWIYLLR